MTPVNFGKNLRFLVPSELETRLLGTHIYTQKADGWSDIAKTQGVFFDLSRIEWVDIGAVVQLVTLIDGALKNRIKILVALPLSRARLSEEKWMQENPTYAKRVMWRIKRRSAAKEFLHYIQFENALQAKHLQALQGNLQIISDYDSTPSSSNEDDFDHFQETEDQEDIHQDDTQEELYKFCFPLTWLSGHQSNKFHSIAKFLAGVIGKNKRGLEALDASTIANVVLYELVENVAQHAGENTWALVAAWARPDYIPPNSLHYLKDERPYIDWLNQKRTSIIEVVVGDSGKGIPYTLEDDFLDAVKNNNAQIDKRMGIPANVMRWAFDRWSSRKDQSLLRGTRGLYRVDRVVKKYQGLITMRAANRLVGWDHGGSNYDKPILNEKKLSQVPGTILRLRIPSYHESMEPRATATEQSHEMVFTTLEIKADRSAGIIEQSKLELQQSLSSTKTDSPQCVIAFIRERFEERESIETLLRQAIEIRHPGALVIYALPGGWDLMDNVVDSINSEHENFYRNVEAYKEQHFEIWDPVLVVDNTGRSTWVGATPSQRKILEALLRHRTLSQLEFEQILPDSKERTSVLLSLRNDTDLIIIKEDGSIHLRFTIPDISSNFSDYVKRKLNQHLTKSGNGILTNGIFRAPSLHIVKKWLDVGKILEATCGADMTMLALSTRLREHSCWKESNPPNFILSDSTSYDENIRLLQKYLDIPQREIIPGETGLPISPGVRIVGQRVIIHCDIIASNETVKRCLRQVLRDDASPVAITCVFDARENKEDTIEMWDLKVPIISLTEADIMANSQIPTKNINPITRQIEEPLVSNELPCKINRIMLCDLIKEKNALHFSHIGRPIGRHFTFYLDVNRLREEKTIHQAFDFEIASWIGHDKALIPKAIHEKIELWHPEPEPRRSNLARGFAEAIHNSRKDISSIRPIRREPAYGRWYFTGTKESSVRSPNVLVIDWGTLTGTTVMQMIRLAAEAGAERILVCVFLSQLPPDEEAFLRSLNSLNIFSPYNDLATNTIPLLPGIDELSGANSKPPTMEKQVQVTVKFLSRFPIASYASNENDCPVCQQLVRLSQEVYPTELLRNFAERQQKERLTPRTREEVIDSTPKDFDLRELSGINAINMAYLREDLVGALGSTQMRQIILERTEQMLKELRDKPSTPSQETLSLLHFLSVETQWLRRPPLYFKALRDSISEIALTVAKNKNVHVSDRLNAIIVLRTSSKLLFANNFSSVFKVSLASGTGPLRHSYLAHPILAI